MGEYVIPLGIEVDQHFKQTYVIPDKGHPAAIAWEAYNYVEVRDMCGSVWVQVVQVDPEASYISQLTVPQIASLAIVNQLEVG